jgi:hypothetical protein
MLTVVTCVTCNFQLRAAKKINMRNWTTEAGALEASEALVGHLVKTYVPYKIICGHIIGYGSFEKLMLKAD